MHDPRAWEQIRAYGRVLEDRLDADPVRTGRLLSLDGQRGPFPVPGFQRPTLAAERWGWQMCSDAVETLRHWIEREQPVLPFTNRDPIMLEAPGEFDHTPAQLGIPLVAACLPGVADATLKRRAALSWSEMANRHDFFAQQLATTVALEHHLWGRAVFESDRAGLHRMPYSVGYHAVEWFCGPPTSGANLPAYSLCLRCGDLLQPRRTTKGQLRCDWCLKEPPEARVWPDSAVMPHDRGRWFLNCQVGGCENVFVGHRQARRCELCVRRRRRAEV